MNPPSQWKIHRGGKFSLQNGSGTVVERGEQLGVAKVNSIANEKLGSKLAKMVGVPVALVEIGDVESLGRSSISLVLNLDAHSLREDGDVVARSYSTTEIRAVRKASGLLPFITWVDAYDHSKDSNFVLYDEGSRIAAVDFEDAFKWGDGPEIIIPRSPPCMENNFDCEEVARILKVIEDLDPEEIKRACVCVFSTDRGAKEAEILDARRKQLRPALRQKGWLC
jgi:hypothetical protein